MQENVTKMQHLKLAYSVPEVSKLTGVCERLIWQAVKDETLKSARFGRRVVISAKNLDRWLDDAASEPYQPVKTGTALRNEAA